MPDPHPNYAYSTVATAPSPATSGTSLVVASGEGTRFPDPASVGAYNCSIWPAGQMPTPANAEIVRVTAKSTDTLTITRTQESTSARTVIVGDQIAAAITDKTFDDLELLLSPGAFLHQSGRYYGPPVVGTSTATNSPSANFMLLTPVHVPYRRSYDRIAIVQTGTGATNYRLGIYGPVTGAPTGTPLVVDGGAVASSGAGTYTVTISQQLEPGWYLLCAITDTSRAIRAFDVATALGGNFSAPGAAMDAFSFFVSQSYGALPSTIPATPAYTNLYYGLWLRAT